MRFLIQISMARRERQPGSRRDVYRVQDDGWYEALVRRDQQMSRWVDDLEAGIAALGEGTPAGQRMSELVAFIEYLEEEMPELLARWRKRRTELRAKRSRPTVTGGE
jgi:DNA-binding transcriptional regulator GbsR (MarR family)